jgi:hypothetical protein
MEKSDYDIVQDFMALLRERGLRESILVTDTGDDCTIHAEIAGANLSFDFDEDDRLVDIRRDD